MFCLQDGCDLVFCLQDGCDLVFYLQDGCDLVFRSSKSESSREYRGVNGTDFEQEIPRNTGEPDDHLLSM